MRHVLMLAFLSLAAARPAAGQRLGIEVLADAEVWETDAGSQLLARNRGVVAAEGRLRGWVLFRLSRRVALLTHAMVEGGSVEPEPPEVYLEQLQFRAPLSQGFVLEGGKILQPVGAFAIRRFSNTNPLIGMPDAYPAQYPWGAMVSGRAGRVDYRLALTSLPPVNTNYTPEPGHRLRPAAGLGISLGPAVRIASTVTHGSYLSSEVSAQLPAGRSWEEYKQTGVATDLRISFEYVEARAEAVWTSYEAPTAANRLHGLGWYVELRGTVSPRVFLAGRFEHYRYPFIRPVNPSFWVANETTQMNGEAGIGYRFSPALLVKTSIRRDHWPVHSVPGAPPFPDGYAVAVQLSWKQSLTDRPLSRY